MTAAHPTPEMLERLTTADVAGLARAIRQVNLANGWDEEFGFDDIPKKLALIHSEIVEAHAATTLRASHRELGDVIVRAVDLVSLVSLDLHPFGSVDFRDPGAGRSRDAQTSTAEWLHELHAHTTSALESWRRAPTPTHARRQITAHLLLLILSAHDLIGARGGETQAILVEIVGANAARPYRHGGRRA